MSNDSKIVSNKIIINGLLNKYNFEIDLDKRLNVLIGENGAGKTTILKIIRHVSEMDFVSLSRYMFKKIILIKGEHQFEINYSDLIPEPASILEGLSDLVLGLMEERISVLYNGLTDARDKDVFFYSLFMSKCFYSEPISGQILNFIPESCYISRMPGIDFTKEYRNSLKKLDQVYNNVRFFKGSEFYEDIKSLITFMSDFILSINKVIPIDLINNITLIDDKILQSSISAPDLDLLHDYIQYVTRYEASKYKKTTSLLVFKEIQRLPIKVEERFEFITQYLNDNIKITIPNKLDLLETVVKLISQKNSFDINLILTRNYYPNKFIRQINESAVKYIISTLGAEKIYGGLDEDFFTPEVIYNIKTYMNPIIAPNSLIGSLVDQIIKVHMMEDFVQVRVEAFKQFYEENIESFLINKSEKVIQFENIINSIFTSKRITVKPNGIEITISNYSKKSGGRFDLITNESNQIRAMDLSSGERKILMMVLISVFLDQSILLLDEPELSISIMWQEKLLDVLMNQTSVKHLIVATHSPFIINEKIIEESVLTLPMEVIK